MGNFGFTGHEHIEEVGLIHMNGRVYDPDLGRFISADPHIQFEKNTQSYNRYSYVSNNPLKYTDPSGYFLDKVFKEIGRFADRVKAELQRMSPELTTALSIGLSFLPGGAWIAGGFNAAVAEANGASFGEIAVSFGIGYAGGQFNGSLNGALHGTISNAFLRGAISGALTGAFTGGVQATINGTSLRKGVQDGMAAGALTSGIVGAIRGNPAERVTYDNDRYKNWVGFDANMEDPTMAGSILDVNQRMDIWNRKAVRGKTTVKEFDGDPYQGVYDQGEWKAFNADGIDTKDLIPHKKIVTAIKLTTLTIDESRMVTMGDFQDYNIIEYDTVYDLVNGKVTNESIYYNSGKVISSGTERTNTNVTKTVETRTCYLLFIGC